MGMSAEDFGAVLGELQALTDYAEALERHAPQDASTRWWFSIRTHATAHFEAREYHEWKFHKNRASMLLAQTVWNQLQRPELRFWILEALGLLEDPHAIYEQVLAIETMQGRNAYLKQLFEWPIIEQKAREEYKRLAAESLLVHRASS